MDRAGAGMTYEEWRMWQIREDEKVIEHIVFLLQDHGYHVSANKLKSLFARHQNPPKQESD